jgi:hypothetical protein
MSLIALLVTLGVRLPVSSDHSAVAVQLCDGAVVKRTLFQTPRKCKYVLTTVDVLLTTSRSTTSVQCTSMSQYCQCLKLQA